MRKLGPGVSRAVVRYVETNLVRRSERPVIPSDDGLRIRLA
jgi:hypothetical protein